MSEYERAEDAFRLWVKADGSTPFAPERDRYHLYISYACPWASRALIVRNVKGLADVIGVTVVDPIRDERGWRFGAGDGFSPDASRLKTRRYLMGDCITEVDWRLFCTLVRFDSVYYVHFKCNLRRIIDYPNLWGYVRDLYQQVGIAETVNMDHIKQHYYFTHDDINPTQFVSVGPADLDFNLPHDRDRI